MSHQLKLFSQVKIGEPFFRDPFKTPAALSTKIKNTKARNPQGEVKFVHPNVLVFTEGIQNDEVFATGQANQLLEAK